MKRLVIDVNGKGVVWRPEETCSVGVTEEETLEQRFEGWMGCGKERGRRRHCDGVWNSPEHLRNYWTKKEGGVGWKDRWDRAGRALKARLRTSHRQLGAPEGSVGRIDMNTSEVYKKKKLWWRGGWIVDAESKIEGRDIREKVLPWSDWASKAVKKTRNGFEIM